MKKQTFIFEFPMSRATINVETNPLYVKDLAIRYISNQESAFGNICLIKDISGNVLAIACYAKDDSTAVKFFTEDESVNDIVSLYEGEGGVSND